METFDTAFSENDKAPTGPSGGKYWTAVVLAWVFGIIIAIALICTGIVALLHTNTLPKGAEEHLKSTIVATINRSEGWLGIDRDKTCDCGKGETGPHAPIAPGDSPELIEQKQHMASLMMKRDILDQMSQEIDDDMADLTQKMTKTRARTSTIQHSPADTKGTLVHDH